MRCHIQSADTHVRCMVTVVVTGQCKISKGTTSVLLKTPNPVNHCPSVIRTQLLFWELPVWNDWWRNLRGKLDCQCWVKLDCYWSSVEVDHKKKSENRHPSMCVLNTTRTQKIKWNVPTDVIIPHQRSACEHEHSGLFTFCDDSFLNHSNREKKILCIS